MSLLANVLVISKLTIQSCGNEHEFEYEKYLRYIDNKLKCVFNLKPCDWLNSTHYHEFHSTLLGPINENKKQSIAQFKRGLFFPSCKTRLDDEAISSLSIKNTHHALHYHGCLFYLEK